MDYTFENSKVGSPVEEADGGGLHRAERIIAAARETRFPRSPVMVESAATGRIVPRRRTEAPSHSPSGGGVSISDLRTHAPTDPWSRAYTHLAENISASLPLSGEALFGVMTPGTEPPYATIMLTGAAVADKLAADVLLIDANYDDSNLARRIGITPKAGLGEVVAGTTDWTLSILKTSVPRLSLLPASRFIRSGRSSDELWMKAFLNALRNRYRLILFAASKPKHKGVRPFLPFCTGAYLVVRLGRTTDRLAKRTVRQTEKYGCRVLGCVVTHD